MKLFEVFLIVVQLTHGEGGRERKRESVCVCWGGGGGVLGFWVLFPADTVGSEWEREKER